MAILRTVVYFELVYYDLKFHLFRTGRKTSLQTLIQIIAQMDVRKRTVPLRLGLEQATNCFDAALNKTVSTQSTHHTPICY